MSNTLSAHKTSIIKLHLLFLSLLFCFPVFGQVVDSVDWSTKDFPFIKVPESKVKLHGWQELYNESGELIAKEKFEEGESLEFIRY